MSKLYPYLAALGVPITAGHVAWADLRERLEQWRYGFALRCRAATAGRCSAVEAEAVLRSMAHDNPKTWPARWKPA